jgi:two-component system nitrogen regulation response regulator GlnG
VRIIAATHQNLEQSVRAGHFREDLFHRLNVIRIHIPPVRDRREDIPLLLGFFLDQAARELNVEPKRVRPEVIEFLQQQEWPGNVRQIENLCRWLTVMASSQEVHMDDLPPELLAEAPDKVENGMDWERALQQWAERELGRGETGLLDRATPAFERIMIEAALRQTHGRRQDAARLLGWGRNTLTRKIKELELDELKGQTVGH